eukprot:6858282-Pyramimonas_sp.AAC.1
MRWHGSRGRGEWCRFVGVDGVTVPDTEMYPVLADGWSVSCTTLSGQGFDVYFACCVIRWAFEALGMINRHAESPLGGVNGF